jgi:hypothetical protein
MKNKKISSRMGKSIDDSLYEIIELNECEPITFQRVKKKQQQLCKPAKSENHKEVILVIPNGVPRRKSSN